MTPDMSDNKQLASRYFELVGQAQLDRLDEVVDPQVVDHTAAPDQQSGLDGLCDFFRSLRAAFPDFTVTVEEMIAEGDLVAARFCFEGTHRGDLMGVPASGRNVQFRGMDFFRVSGGRITGLWGVEDMFGLMRQIGALPE